MAEKSGLELSPGYEFFADSGYPICGLIIRRWKMTEAELWDQQVQWMVAGGDSIAGFITIMFAFLVMAYFAGSKLSRIQLIIVSALFVWVSCVQIYAVVGYFYRAKMFVERLQELNPELQFFLSAPIVLAVALMMAIGSAVCLFFLYQTRKGLARG